MLLSSKDKSCLWHIQPAFTQGLKSYICSTKMFKLALQHSSSGKLIVLFVQQKKAPHFLNSRCTCMSLHTHPPPLNVHPTASTFRRKPYDMCEWQEQTFKHCSCLFKHNFVLSYGPACAKNIAGVLHKHTTLLKALSQCIQGKGISQIWQTITCRNLAF